MSSFCVRGATPSHLDVAVAVTSEPAIMAQRLHDLRTTSAIALGRLLTAAGLLAATSKAEGKTSLQVLSKGRIGQLFVDATHTGNLRGLVKNTELAFPRSAGEPVDGRRSVGAAVRPGGISAVRRRPNGEYFQSMTPLASGEVDADIEHFLEQSDQIPTVLVADVLVDDHGRVVRAGGVLVQSLPDGDRERLAAIRHQLASGRFASMLRRTADPHELLLAVDAQARRVDADLPLRWHCPCSYDRALNAVRLMGASEIARMSVEKDPVTIDCDFCNSHYEITPEDLDRILAETTTARA